MAIFQHILWGYEITYPNDWIHQTVQDSDAFAPTLSTLDPHHQENNPGQVLIRGEWNWERQPIEPLWNRHIGMLAGMLGAKEVGSAPWHIGDATGLEAEIVLPKKDNRRLWTGVLQHDCRVLQFMATHPKEARAQFEPVATKVIASLRFPNRIMEIETSPEGLPLPPDYTLADPQSILTDISDPLSWRAYVGKFGIGALQAFYLRELPIHNWEIEEYIPFPGPSDLGFVRFQLYRGNSQITLGLTPYESTETNISSALANLVFKIT